MSVASAEITIPFVPETRTELSPPPTPSMVSDFVIVTAPNPPGSRVSISPPAAVFEIAPANVLQGAVRLHGFASSPTPETHVRVACAYAADVAKADKATATAKFLIRMNVLLLFSKTQTGRLGQPGLGFGQRKSRKGYCT